jgi:hypothetical protein
MGWAYYQAMPVSERARERGKRRKAAVAGRLTQKSNPELIAALVYVMRHLKAGEWTSREASEAVNTHFRTLDRRMRDAIRCSKWMLKTHFNI